MNTKKQTKDSFVNHKHCYPNNPPDSKIVPGIIRVFHDVTHKIVLGCFAVFEISEKTYSAKLFSLVMYVRTCQVYKQLWKSAEK